MRRRHELTDEQWELIQDLLPGKAGDPGRTAIDNRLFVDAVLYVLKTGIPWDDLPARFGKPNTVWKRYDRWCANHVWQRIARALGEPDLEEVQLDSTMIKAHPVASTGRRQSAGKKADAHLRRCLGRSRGGLTTKLHAAVDRVGRLLQLTLTPGQRNDSTQAAALLEQFQPHEVGHVLADAAYDSDATRKRVQQLKAKACIKPIKARKVRKRYDRTRYKNRNVVERFFNRLKRFRRAATRYDKKPTNFTGFIWLAALMLQIS